MGLMGNMSAMMGMGETSAVAMVHMLWGFGLAVGGFIVGVGALASGRAHLGVAGWAGLRYLMAGQHNAMSFTMAVGWLVAILAYLVIAREHPILL